MSDEMNRLISRFAAGSRTDDAASDGHGGKAEGRSASSGAKPWTGKASGMNAFLKPGGAAAEKPEKAQAPKADGAKASAAAKSPKGKAAEEEEWTLPSDVVSGKSSDGRSSTPSPELTDPEPGYPPRPEVIPEPEPPKPGKKSSLFSGRRREKKPRRETVYATVETAGARPAEKLPFRNGYVGRVYNLEQIPEDDIPPKVTRWFTSLLTGAPYTPTDSGVIFYLQPEEGDMDGRILQVTAYGNLGLTNHMRLCVQGRSESTGTVVAHRIERDASIDPARSDWTPVRDRRQRSALSLWLMIAGIALLVVLLIQGLVMPLFAWLAVYGAEILVWVIFIAIVIFMFRGSRRGGRGWF